ncbi:SKN-1 Dependent Zygotic transcript [Caenorhabditis elegans]|uniref:SKN-1 Dependent Zygotic transcript n=1 Tax=Caenorhabditis elegans TaxID=6239 RepID=Q23434_CAEEL|nr:SKN-1 Dependent Zygotic transcript [Caenorhabditis elegans]CAA92503.1 SKN-1 Dependent Zygotic transcript [Caenorhabditis elegans]|eukprot:NP_501723.1 SKN-1 Dependent Zygotic transcript [Caenorhabditis elegans]
MAPQLDSKNNESQNDCDAAEQAFLENIRQQATKYIFPPIEEEPIDLDEERLLEVSDTTMSASELLTLAFQKHIALFATKKEPSIREELLQTSLIGKIQDFITLNLNSYDSPVADIEMEELDEYDVQNFFTNLAVPMDH